MNEFQKVILRGRKYNPQSYALYNFTYMILVTGKIIAIKDMSVIANSQGWEIKEEVIMDNKEQSKGTYSKGNILYPNCITEIILK